MFSSCFIGNWRPESTEIGKNDPGFQLYFWKKNQPKMGVQWLETCTIIENLQGFHFAEQKGPHLWIVENSLRSPRTGGASGAHAAGKS
jgi:hypothetical protein